jgi:hypothetical protein
MRQTIISEPGHRPPAFVAAIFGFIALIPSAVAAQPSSLPLRAGASASYKFHCESTLTLAVNGREQEEGLDATLELRAEVGQKNQQGQTPVKVRVQRIQAKATRFRSEYSLDTNRRDAGKPMATTQFAPLLALSQQPLELLYEQGRLVQVGGADEFAAKLEQLLKKDFQGSEEYEFASPVYAALAGNEALLTAWKNVVVAELPVAAKAGEPWIEEEDLQFTGDVPSEAWLGMLQAHVKTTSRMKQETDGSSEITSQFEAGQNETRQTKLGPNDFSYSVSGVAGKRTLHIDADGLVRELTLDREIKVTGKLEFGDGIPIELNSAVTVRLERANATP